jgi:hypothetical protein
MLNDHFSHNINGKIDQLLEIEIEFMMENYVISLSSTSTKSVKHKLLLIVTET